LNALETGELQSAAVVLAICLLILDASAAGEIEAAFLKLVERRVGAFLLGTDPFFITTRNLLVSLASRHKLTAIYLFRESFSASSRNLDLNGEVRTASAKQGSPIIPPA
jgi:hypothetical protein